MTTTATDPMDSYFTRQQAKADALTRHCETCESAPGERCIDSTGWPTSMVHQARHTDYVDPYALSDEVGERVRHEPTCTSHLPGDNKCDCKERWS